ncbi:MULTISPECIES: DUF5050 domain-containing protein [Caloramator]|uniref:Hypothetical secreted protein n=1 Tax=Caloramator australicus RC3 TaxID=857293 RepID=I7KWG9_9CLOT|nr:MULTISPECIES: DUF5050 domain-containing protein [Caloramator]MDO6355935.1 DUF5050 domain-containing protein [Caloramator sp. CAR-1]CCJ34511.1 Hypothetical secreted protein [Caloramator australicus RC3]
MRRFVAFILTVIMIIGMLPKMAFAAKAVNLPKNSIIIADRIYTSSYVSKFPQEVNQFQSLQGNENKIFSIDAQGNITDKDGRAATEEQIMLICGRKLTLYSDSPDDQGKVYIADGSGIFREYKPGSTKYGYITINTSFSAAGSGYNLVSVVIKEIVGVPNSYYFVVSDSSTIDPSVKRATNESFTLITNRDDFYINLYSASGDLVGQGEIKDVSSSVTGLPVLINLKTYSLGNIPTRVAGNISNLGLAATDGEFLYYVNLADGGKIYKKNIYGVEEYPIVEDNARYINVVDDWIYYSNISDGGKIYKVNVDGTGRKKINDVLSSYVNVVGDYIYYSNSKDKNRIYKLSKFNTNASYSGQRLTYDSAAYIVVDGDRNKIYYSNTSDARRLYSIDLNGNNRTKFLTVSSQTSPGVRYLSLTNDGIVYATGLDGKLYKTISYNRISPVYFTTEVQVKSKGGTITKSVEDKLSVINAVTNNDIFYSSYVDGRKIYKLGVSSGTKIIDDLATAINIAGDYIFYLKSGKLYRYKLGSPEGTKPEAIAKIKYADKIVKIDDLDPVEITDLKNIELPDKVTAIMSDGDIRELLVNWDMSKYSVKDGVYTFSGKVVGYGTKVSGKAVMYSAPINMNNVVVTNNEGSKADSIVIKGLALGDEVYVYDENDMTKPLGKAKADKTGQAVISKIDLNQEGGVIKVAVKRAGRALSKFTDVAYSSEAPVVVKVEYTEYNNKKVYKVTYKGINDKIGYRLYNADNSIVKDYTASPITATPEGSGLFSFEIERSVFEGYATDKLLKLAYYDANKGYLDPSKPYIMIAQAKPNVSYDFTSGRFVGFSSFIECSLNGIDWMSSDEMLSQASMLTGKTYILARYKAMSNKMPGQIAYVALVPMPQVVIKAGGEIILDSKDYTTFIIDDITGTLTARYIGNADITVDIKDVPSGINASYVLTKGATQVSAGSVDNSAIESTIQKNSNNTGEYKLVVTLNQGGTEIAKQTIKFRLFGENIAPPQPYLAGILGKTINGVTTGYKVKVMVPFTDSTVSAVGTIRLKDSISGQYGNSKPYNFVLNNGVWEGEEVANVEGEYEVSIRYENYAMKPSTFTASKEIRFTIDTSKVYKVYLYDGYLRKIGLDVIEGLVYPYGDATYSFVGYTDLYSFGVEGRSITGFEWLDDENDTTINDPDAQYGFYVKYRFIDDNTWSSIKQGERINYRNNRTVEKYRIKVTVINFKNGYKEDFEYEFEISNQ